MNISQIITCITFAVMVVIGFKVLVYGAYNYLRHENKFYFTADVCGTAMLTCGILGCMLCLYPLLFNIIK